MNGLNVLYANEAAKGPGWVTIPEQDSPGRLREEYWARREISNSSGKPSLSVGFGFASIRAIIGRTSNEPGDEFAYFVEMGTRVEHKFEWFEVTEVLTTVPVSQIESAMRVWNGIRDKYLLNFEEFLVSIPRGRPTRKEQQ